MKSAGNEGEKGNLSALLLAGIPNSRDKKTSAQMAEVEEFRFR